MKIRKAGQKTPKAKKQQKGLPLVTQWSIRLYAPNAGGKGLIVFSLVRELRSHLPHSMTLKTKKREKEIRLVIPRIVCLLVFCCAGLSVFVAIMRLSLVEESRGYASLW